MKQVLKHLLVAALLAGALASSPLLNAADPTPKAPDKAGGRTKEAPAQSQSKRDWYPFGGIVSSVDKQANTISLKKKEGERVLKLDAKTTLEISGKPVTIGSVKVGSYAHGKLHKDSAGNEVITDAKFDKEPPSKAKETLDKEPPKTAAPKSK
ncbi:MAG TPA: hypothetical protein P5534_03870 [Candidatus Paceibacterota bacterium]|nr:hypothetical protein [Candidatus Paceibacterota bacterium]HRZ55816.1 hypothetical protein [Candidatus Paceibacterota bacterium]